MKAQSDDLLAQVKLQGVVRVRTGRYSGGMRRRLSVAIALLGAPTRLSWHALQRSESHQSTAYGIPNFTP